AKIVGQEGAAAFRLALWTAEELAPFAGADKSLAELRSASAIWTELLPKLMEIGGRMSKENDRIGKIGDALSEPAGESAAATAARGAVSAYGALSGGYNNDAVRAAGDAAEAAARTFTGKQLADYLVALDDRILLEELSAQMLAKGTTASGGNVSAPEI